MISCSAQLQSTFVCTFPLSFSNSWTCWPMLAKSDNRMKTVRGTKCLFTCKPKVGEKIQLFLLVVSQKNHDLTLQLTVWARPEACTASRALGQTNTRNMGKCKGGCGTVAGECRKWNCRFCFFFNDPLSPPITGEAALQREEGIILFYYLFLVCVFLVWLSYEILFSQSITTPGEASQQKPKTTPEQIQGEAPQIKI